MNETFDTLLKELLEHTKLAKEIVLSAGKANGKLPYEAREEALWHIRSSKDLIKSAEAVAKGKANALKLSKLRNELVVISILWRNTKAKE